MTTQLDVADRAWMNVAIRANNECAAMVATIPASQNSSSHLSHLSHCSLFTVHCSLFTVHWHPLEANAARAPTQPGHQAQSAVRVEWATPTRVNPSSVSASILHTSWNHFIAGVPHHCFLPCKTMSLVLQTKMHHQHRPSSSNPEVASAKLERVRTSRNL